MHDRLQISAANEAAADRMDERVNHHASDRDPREWGDTIGPRTVDAWADLSTDTPGLQAPSTARRATLDWIAQQRAHLGRAWADTQVEGQRK